MGNLTIGQIAAKAGMSRDAIRIYERQGLIEEPKRSANGYRIYSENTIIHLRFIQRAKGMGFTLKEIGELLAIKKTATNTCEKVRYQAKVKLADIERKISALQSLSKVLNTIVLACEDQGNTEICPILEALEQQKMEDIL